MSGSGRQRQRYDAQFKVKLFAALLEGKIGVEELAQEHGLSPGMLYRWRREEVQRLRQAAQRDPAAPVDVHAENEQLRSRLAEQELELDFFAQAFGQLDRPNAKG